MKSVSRSQSSVLLAMILSWTAVTLTLGFSLTSHASKSYSQTSSSSSALFMADNLFRAARSAAADDNVVELMRPLGLILKQDDETGNVYVDKIAPKGNAARTGKVSALMMRAII
jgi:hypothetical protein